MSLFAPQAGPRLYRMPPGVDFAAGFSAGLAARMDGMDQTARPSIEVRLNTTRSVRAVEAGLARAAPGLLPRLTTVDAPAHPLKVIPTLRRRLILGRIVAAYLDAQPGLAPKAAAFDYADSLAALLDEMGEAGVTGDAFASLAPADHAEHWQRGQAMLDLVARAWPQHLAEAEGDALDPGAALRRAVLRETADWAAAPPKTPLIIAGSTGSRAPTHLMLKAVAFLPQGAVVLPGVDPHLDAEDLAQIAQSAPDHPQSAIARLLVALDMAPADIPIWHGAPPLEARSRLISLSLRPAPVTHIWRDAIPLLQTEVGAALADVTLLAAPSARAEADAIALALRHAIEQGETAALVTPDRDLARRVTAALGRWGLVPDDTAGRPLSLAPPGILLRLIAQGLGPPMSPVGVLEILGHPLVASGDQEARARHRDGVIALEQRILPDLPGPLDWDAVASHRAMTDPDWLAWVRETLAPLEASPRSLSAWLSLHLDCAQRLAAGYGSDGEGGLWDKQAGLTARRMMEHLAQHADAAGTLSALEYRSLFESLVVAENVRDAAYLPDPRLRILGTLEARTMRSDLMILGGLNQSAWPAAVPADPWLNREMRARIGLASPERRVGLQAHDYQSAVNAPKVILSRALKVDGSPMVASRWLTRLTNLVKGLGEAGKAALHAAEARGAEWVAMAAALDAPAAVVPPARRPAPRTPRGTFPARLGATRIETLIRDPYAVYASHVLRLAERSLPGQTLDARARGTVLHEIMERFVQATAERWPQEPQAMLHETARLVLADRKVPPALGALWQARLRAMAPGFLREEAKRRAEGRLLGLEVKGSYAVPGTAFTLDAKADRIERHHDGTLGLYDYKTSKPGSARQVVEFAVQLPLMGLMAEAGGFAQAGIGGAPMGAMALLGMDRDATRTALTRDAAELDALADRLARMVAYFDSAGAAWPALWRPHLQTHPSPYDHLARRGEWQDDDPWAPEPVGEGAP